MSPFQEELKKQEEEITQKTMAVLLSFGTAVNDAGGRIMDEHWMKSVTAWDFLRLLVKNDVRFVYEKPLEILRPVDP